MSQMIDSARETVASAKTEIVKSVKDFNFAVTSIRNEGARISRIRKEANGYDNNQDRVRECDEAMGILDAGLDEMSERYSHLF